MDSLSVEAQPSLQQDNELFDLSSQSHGFVEDEGSAAEQPCEKPASERRRSKRQSKIPGCLTLSLKHRARIGSGRARFNPGRRQEVANVRHLGACGSCRTKKIACSETTPCKPCERQNLLCPRQELTISRIDPVPVSLRNVDIFDMGPPRSLQFYKQLIRSHKVTLEPDLEWDPHMIIDECIGWLCGVTGPSATYDCGWALSVHTTQKLFSNLIPKSIGNRISELLEKITVFNYPDTNAPLEESYTQIQRIEAFVCSQMLQAIEGLLQPEALAKSSQDQLIGLSILLFGELVSAGYSNTKTIAWDQTSESQKGARRFCEARTQLLRILIHHLVKIAGPLHNPRRKLCENQLLEQFSSGLADRGGFDWAMPLRNRTPELIPNASAQAEEEEKQPIPKPILNSHGRIVEANNAQLPSLSPPIDAKSVSTDHLPLDSTTEEIQTIELLERNPFQRCTSCIHILNPDELCQSCRDNYDKFDASVDHTALHCDP